MTKASAQYGLLLLRATKAIQHNINYIEQSVRTKACNTHCLSSSGWDTTLNQIAQIDKLLGYRDTLVYLQDTINSSMQALPSNVSRLLRLVFVKRYPKKAVADHMGYSLRTLYRRIDSAVLQLHRALTHNGITYSWLVDNVKPIADIMF